MWVTNLSGSEFCTIKVSGSVFFCTKSRARIFRNRLSLGLEFLNSGLSISASLGFKKEVLLRALFLGCTVLSMADFHLHTYMYRSL